MALATATFTDVLDDLSSRFIINIPEEEQSSIERICFQIEQAHWFYEDFVRVERPDFPSFSLRTFTAKFFQHCPLLQSRAHEHEKAYKDFIEYKTRVPVCGAIILTEGLDKCLLVKGWSSKSAWGFPKGKINQDEEDDLCAAREVYEETGFDITPYLKKEQYIQLMLRGQRIRLYIISGVSESTVFTPMTRKEISAIEWFRLSDLPAWKVDKAVNGAGKSTLGQKFKNTHFYGVAPFVSKLKQQVLTLRKEKKQLMGDVLQDAATKTSLDVSPIDASDMLKSMLGIGRNAIPSPSTESQAPTEPMLKPVSLDQLFQTVQQAPSPHPHPHPHPPPPTHTLPSFPSPRATSNDPRRQQLLSNLMSSSASPKVSSAEKEWRKKHLLDSLYQDALKHSSPLLASPHPRQPQNKPLRMPVPMPPAPPFPSYHQPSPPHMTMPAPHVPQPSPQPPPPGQPMIRDKMALLSILQNAAAH